MYRTLLSDINSEKGERLIVSGWVSKKEKKSSQNIIVVRDPSGEEEIILSNGREGHITVGSYISIQSQFQRGENNALVACDPEIEIVVQAPKGNKEKEMVLGNSGTQAEELRKRYFALRSPRLQRNLRIVDDIIAASSEVLRKNHFVNIDTPYLTRSVYEYTGEDFVVSAPLWNGRIAHLAQSPQLYKQLLMAGGIERYFQYARNFRAEAGDPTHLQEFTQIDAEMTTSNPKEVQKVIEDVVKEIFVRVKGIKIETPFPSVNYEDAENGRNHNISKDGFRWVINAPLAKSNSKGVVVPLHHAMTKPVHDEQLRQAKMPQDLSRIIGSGYDLEYHGLEIGGGDLRLVDEKLQTNALRLYGLKDSEIKKGFGALLEAMEAGIPQHGGFAIGLCRLAMILAEEKSLDGVIAFPMNENAETALNNIPFKPKNGIVPRLG